MTKTYTSRGGVAVWDPNAAKVIARFSKGETPEDPGTFTTSDEALIARLDAMGYKGETVDGDEPVAVEPGPVADVAVEAAGETTEAVDGDEPKAKTGRKPKAEG